MAARGSLCQSHHTSSPSSSAAAAAAASSSVSSPPSSSPASSSSPSPSSSPSSSPPVSAANLHQVNQPAILSERLHRRPGSIEAVQYGLPGVVPTRIRVEPHIFHRKWKPLKEKVDPAELHSAAVILIISDDLQVPTTFNNNESSRTYSNAWISPAKPWVSPIKPTFFPTLRGTPTTTKCH